LSLKEYSTIKGEASSHLVISKSKFVGFAKNVESPKQAAEVLETIKKKNWDADHNCYAYIIGKNKEHMKFSDDGEPSGTAGIPMLEVLKKSGLTDILTVSTRHFGGIKLGAGGLVRAYSLSVSEILKNAEKQKFVPCNIFKQAVEYDVWAKIEPRVTASGAIVFSKEYLEKVYLKVGLKENDELKIRTIFREALKTDEVLEFIETDYVIEN